MLLFFGQSAKTFSVVLLGLDEVSFNSFYFVSPFSQFEYVVAEGFPEVIWVRVCADSSDDRSIYESTED